MSARYGELQSEALRLEESEKALRARILRAPVMEERAEPRDTRLHLRGGFLTLGEPVAPDVPAALPPLASDPSKRRRTRLDLARWLVDPANPLTARVAVNRVWERVFGRGLVATSDDFGTRGEPPTHPELLDWLALDFVEHGWSFRHLHALITSSATWRAASGVRPGDFDLDPDNRLLARGAKYRLDAETVRDVALAASGLLVQKVGGPSVMPPQPDGVWAPVYSSDTWRADTGPDRYRRGLYTFWKRSSPYATFVAFDAPSRELACTRRARTNTPLQALALLNDPAFVECADALGERMRRASAASDVERLRFGFRACTARAPDDAELAVLQRLLASERADLRPPPAEPGAPPGAHDAERAAWMRVANVLLNLDETITRH
ncbi:MAG: DUF1553 domain-containing protein [Planctomycetes bacterium]|nr:DUF1553 domain-containing protein [Planctomycetota bacterium]